MLTNEVFDKVFTLVKEAMHLYTDASGKAIYSDLFVTRTIRNDIEPKLPCLYLSQIGGIQIGNDLVRTSQNAIDSTFQVESYSNISYEEAYEILDVAGDIMIGLGYSLTYGIQELSDENTWRFVARFNRKVGANDVLTII